MKTEQEETADKEAKPSPEAEEPTTEASVKVKEELTPGEPEQKDTEKNDTEGTDDSTANKESVKMEVVSSTEPDSGATIGSESMDVEAPAAEAT